MAALVCLPPKAVEKIKNAALAGKVEIAKLYEMSSKERRDFFSKQINDEALGKFVNTEFEKAMVSKQQDALLSWAKSIFTPQAQTKAPYKTVLDKINNLGEMGVLTPSSEKAFLEDLVSDKLGVNVTAGEVAVIAAKAERIDAAFKELGDDLLDPRNPGANLDFFTAKADMDKYLQSLNPANNLQVATGTIGRGSMLFSVKSPLLNIGSNIEVGITEALVRRIANKQWVGADRKLASDYMKMAAEIYNKTGYDISRMTSLADGGVSGERVLGDTVHAQGKGTVRKVGRFFEDVVFNKLMGYPDMKFGVAHFVDSVGLGASAISKDNPVAAKALMADAMRLEPKTPDGVLLREQAILDAQTATWTNKGWATTVTLGIRKLFNNLAPDLRIGDYLMPFVKTPANVIETGLDYAGLGIPKALFTGVKAMRAGELHDREVIQKLGRDLTRAGLGLTGATILASQIQSENFMGAYDPQRKQIEQLKNSNTNSVKIGDKWISLDWFGPLSVSMTAQLYAKKYGGSNPADKSTAYYDGLKSSVLNLPGIKDVTDYGKSEAYKTNEHAPAGERVQAAGNYAAKELFSRLVPSFISDIAKATDPYQRETEKGAAGLKGNIPVIRKDLPIKRDIFGDPIKTEGAASSILFGSRVKQDKSNKLTKELEAVGKANGKNVNFTDWKKSSAKGVTQFKEKVGKEKFNKATIEYGQDMKKRLDTLFKSNSYKQADDATKLALINKQDADAQKHIFNKYNFKPKKTKSLLSAYK